jgi:hypothetical protein
MVPRRVLPHGFLETCIPTRAVKPPSGPGWVHEIKHDGYRLIVRHDGDAVRLFTRRRHDWTDRYPAIAAAAVKLRSRSFTIDGEAVVVGVDGVAVFDPLHRRQRAADAILYAFDLLELNAKDQRPSPLVERKAKLAKLLARAPAGHHLQRGHRRGRRRSWARPDHRESPGRRGLFLSLPPLLRLLRCPCFPRSRDQEVLAFFSGLESGSHPLRCESPTSPSFRGIFWIAIFGGYRTSRASPAYLTAAPSAIEPR